MIQVIDAATDTVVVIGRKGNAVDLLGNQLVQCIQLCLHIKGYLFNQDGAVVAGQLFSLIIYALQNVNIKRIFGRKQDNADFQPFLLSGKDKSGNIRLVIQLLRNSFDFLCGLGIYASAVI